MVRPRRRPDDSRRRQQGRPAELEGVKVEGRWVVIYSKNDIGCILDNPAAPDGKGYDHESAVRIATNVVRYATHP